MIKINRSIAVEINEEIDHNLKKFQAEYKQENSNPIDMDRIKKMILIVLILFFSRILRGSILIPSIIGITR